MKKRTLQPPQAPNRFTHPDILPESPALVGDGNTSDISNASKKIRRRCMKTVQPKSSPATAKRNGVPLQTDPDLPFDYDDQAEEGDVGMNPKSAEIVVCEEINTENGLRKIYIYPCRASKYKPGSEEKVLLLAARYAAQVRLWDPKDLTDHGPKTMAENNAEVAAANTSNTRFKNKVPNGSSKKKDDHASTADDGEGEE